MNLQELKEKLKTAKLHPVHLEGSPLDGDMKDSPFDRDRDMRGETFVGNLEEYFEAAHVFGASAVLIYTETIDAERFQYEIEIDDEESEVATEVFDLCKFNPELERFKEQIGQVGIFKLSIPIPDARISFYITEDWWRDFFKLWIETTDRIDENQEAAHAKLHAAQLQKEKQILKLLASLINDEDFVRLRTQLSMMEYAKEKIPELETVDAATLKSEIQTLQAKIKAKGLGSKRRV